MKKKTVGQVFKAERKKQGLTQKQVADKAGIDSVTYSRVELGKQKPSYDTVLAVSKALRIDPPK